jgi:hypothetical protein
VREEGAGAVEKDPDNLLVLVREINRLLEEKETRLKSASAPADLPEQSQGQA